MKPMTDKALHPTLRRQMKRAGITDLSSPPSPAAWNKLLARVNQTYTQAEQDRYLLERSLEISSTEMEQLYRELKTNSESRLKELNEKLRIARDQALRASDAKSAFLASMSHELRTPLNAILGYSELILEAFDTIPLDELEADLEKIHASAKHLLDLLNDILDLSKIEAGKFELAYEYLSIEEAFLTELVDVIKPLFQRNQNQFHLQHVDTTSTIRIDPMRLRQILLNLLSNASKFTRRGSVSLHVRSIEKEGSTWVQFAIEDTGIGISQANLERLFKPYTQADAKTSARFGGTGLGLTISKHLTELMGGVIEAQSQLGQGSTFCVSFPTLPHPGEHP